MTAMPTTGASLVNQMFRPVLAAGATVLLLAGCVSFGDKAPPQLLTLTSDAAPTAGSMASASVTEAIIARLIAQAIITQAATTLSTRKAKPSRRGIFIRSSTGRGPLVHRVLPPPRRQNA